MTLDELYIRRALYFAAEVAVLGGQEYRIRDGVIDRMVKRADLQQIREEIANIDGQIMGLTTRLVPRRVIYLR